MIKTLKKHFLIFTMLICIVMPNLVLAQDPLDDGPDPPPVPINDHINIMIVLMIVFLFLFFYYREYKKND
jgi:hypothetical protein